MPFTLYPDMLHIYYHPYFLASKGVWNIYNYHADFFKEQHYSYYGPLTYLFFGSYLYISKPFLSGFDKFMENFRNVSDHGGGHSGHYLIEAPRGRLFRFLFLMKLPYLFFDIALLGLMTGFTHAPGAMRIRLLKWWALNPLLIYTCYLFGQFDIIPTFFMVLGAFLAFNGKKTLAMISLGSGAALKGFPLFLVFPFSFYMGRDIKGIIKYALIGILPFLIIVGPYYFLTNGKVMNAFFTEAVAHRLGFTNIWGVIRSSIFILCYLGLCLSLLKESVRKKMGRLWPIKVSFLTLILLFMIFPISFHYFLWITPFILILGSNLRVRIMNFYLLSIFLLGLTTVVGRSMWFGLFSPIYPEFFMGLPSFDEIIGRLLPYALVKKGATIAFIGTLAWMSSLVLRAGEKCFD